MEACIFDCLRKNGAVWTPYDNLHAHIKAAVTEYNKRDVNRLLSKLVTDHVIERREGEHKSEFRLVPPSVSVPYESENIQTRSFHDIKNKSHFVQHFINVVKSNEKGYANKAWITETLTQNKYGEPTLYKLSFGDYAGKGASKLRGKCNAAWKYFSEKQIMVPDHFF